MVLSGSKIRLSMCLAVALLLLLRVMCKLRPEHILLRLQKLILLEQLIVNAALDCEVVR